MKTIVITGSTRGIGLGLARAFLDQGHAVVISGSSQTSVDQTMSELTKIYPSERLLGCACDVRERGQVEQLWETAQQHFGRVDIWINNAGRGADRKELYDLAPETLHSVVDINLLGVMHGCSVAIHGMQAQGGGFIYNMEGLGSDGRPIPGTLLYGTTKSALRYLNRGLIKSLKGSPVKLGSLSPGMVITDLLTGSYDQDSQEWQQARKIFRILADRVETVTPWLVERILGNDKHGAHINWLTTSKVIWRFLSAWPTKRDFVKTA